MPLGIQQNNNFLHLTMDVWQDQIFFNDSAFPAGYFAADILNVINHDVHAFKHFVGRLTRGSVERMYGQPRALVHAGLHSAARINVTAHTMLGGVQGHKIHIRSLVEYVYGRVEPAVDSRRIGHQTDPQPFEQLETTIPEHLYSDFHAGARTDGSQQRRRANQVTETVAIQHIITIIKNPT